jgi:hypothetical protein
VTAGQAGKRLKLTVKSLSIFATSGSMERAEDREPSKKGRADEMSIRPKANS